MPRLRSSTSQPRPTTGVVGPALVPALVLALFLALVATPTPGNAATPASDRVAQTSPAARVKAPVAGTYKSKGGGVTFRVTRGKPRVAGLRAFLTGTCGGYPDLPSYASGYYSFPTTVIPRNGRVVRTVKGKQDGASYTIELEMKIVGARVTDGAVSYAGPGQCFLDTTFTARRT